MNSPPVTLRIDRLGHHGEGVAEAGRGPIYVPYALPGDTIIAETEADRGRLIEILEPGADRVPAFCPYFTQCGGCAVQGLADAPYAAWKRSIVVTALAHAGLQADVAPLVDAHGEGRRRATFHARVDGSGTRRLIHVGYMAARTHAIVDIAACPLLAPSMAGALPAARAIATTVETLGKPLDILVTGTKSGLDIDVRGCGALPAETQQALIHLAEKLDVARLANHGDCLIERRTPVIEMAGAVVAPPPGAFLQATEAGEIVLARLAMVGLAEAKRIADLFAGIGTFSLRLATQAHVHAVEADKAALRALSRAASGAPGLREVTIEARDLHRRPLTPGECAHFDAVLFDPPRAGAETQVRLLAGSSVPIVVAVSCHAASFARDARILVDGGYAIESVTPVDQFRHSPHVEIVALFRRPKARRKKALLG